MSTKPPSSHDALARALATQADPSQLARRKSLEYLRSVWKEELQGCPICGTNDWGVNDVANLPVREETMSFPLGTTRVYPLVPITCKKCGYTFFLNEKWVLAGGTPEGLVEG